MVLFLAGAWAAAFAETPPAAAEGAASTVAEDEEDEETQAAFERYKSILDRMPFGEVPPGYDPSLPPGSAAAAAAAAAQQAVAGGEMTEEQRTEEQQKMAASVRVSVLNISPSGRTMVGFTDSSAQPPENYYLPVGGERNGWSVKAADPAEEKITLAKDGIEVTVKLGEGTVGDGKGGKKDAGGRRFAGFGARGGLSRGAPPGALAPGAPPGAGNMPNNAMGRLRMRRAQQLAEQQAQAAQAAKAAAEEKAERERQAQAREQAAAEREEQRNALLQIQEELRRQREEKAARAAQDGGESGEQE